MSEPIRIPERTASGLLDEALGGRAREVQARLVDQLSRGDVRALAHAIDEVVMWSVGAYAAAVATYGAQREQALRDLLMTRRRD
jgi:hypothetical protein